MRIHYYSIPLMILVMIACDQTLTVEWESQPGSVSGRVYPLDAADGQVGLYRGIINCVHDTALQADGTFLLESIPHGTYLLRASASNYGSVEQEITLEEGAALDVGELRLTLHPWPIDWLDPWETLLQIDDEIRFFFQEPMDVESVLQGVSIYPEPSGLDLVYSDYYQTDDHFKLQGNWNYNSQYLVTFDTSITTEMGRHLERAYETIVQTDPFQIFDAQPYAPDGFANTYVFTVNGEVEMEQLETLLSTDPIVPFSVSCEPFGLSYTKVRVYPLPVWRSGANSLTLAAGLTESGGTVMLRDTVLQWTMDNFRMVSTTPEHNQRDVYLFTDIEIRLNNQIDEATLAASISVDPSFDYDLEYTPPSSYYMYGEIRLDLNAYLSQDTRYTITVDSTLHDYWGTPLATPCAFSFTTGN